MGQTNMFLDKFCSFSFFPDSLFSNAPPVGARRFIVGPMNSRGKQRVGNEGEVRKLLFTNQGKLEVTDIEA